MLEGLHPEALANLIAGSRAAETPGPMPAGDPRIGEVAGREIEMAAGIRDLGGQAGAARNPAASAKEAGRYSGQKSGVVSGSSAGPSPLTEQMTSSASSGPSLWTER